MKKNIIENIYKISKDEQYWLFRAGTDAEYFDKFYSRKEIGMGWDKINTLAQMSTKNILDDEVKSKYPLDKTPWNIINKIHRFHSVMKKGDIIIMPDSGKKRVAFGRLIDDISRVEQIEIMEQKTLLTIKKNENEGENKTDPGYINKFRKVKWLKIIEKEKLTPRLLLHLYAPHTISILAESVRYEVNKLLNDIFIIEDKIYLKYKIETESDIHAEDIKIFFDLIKYVEQIVNIVEDNGEKISVKINVNSPGDIIAKAIAGTMILLAFGYVINGGEIKVKSKKFGVEMSAGGGKSLYDYIEQSHDYKLSVEQKDKLKKIEIEIKNEITPEKISRMKANLKMVTPEVDN